MLLSILTPKFFPINKQQPFLFSLYRNLTVIRRFHTGQYGVLSEARFLLRRHNHTTTHLLHAGQLASRYETYVASLSCEFVQILPFACPIIIYRKSPFFPRILLQLIFFVVYNVIILFQRIDSRTSSSAISLRKLVQSLFVQTCVHAIQEYAHKKCKLILYIAHEIHQFDFLIIAQALPLSIVRDKDNSRLLRKSNRWIVPRLRSVFT